MNKYFEYVGCIHVHTNKSDGSGSLAEVIAAAKDSELDYLMISDHMTLAGWDERYYGWYFNDLFVIIGYEINDCDDRHHYLAFGLEKVLPPELNHQEYIKAVRDAGATGIVAHPFEEREPSKSLPGFPPIPWGNLNYPEIEIIEVWNMMSHWLEATTMKNRFWNVIHPRSISTFPTRSLLKWLDEVNLSRKVTGVGSVDVHATPVKILGLYTKAIFDYKIMFKSIRTHLLSSVPITANDGLDAQKKILDLLKEGKTFISNYRRGDARGFRFWIETDGQIGTMGDTIEGRSGHLHVHLPLKGTCRVIRDGQVIHTTNCRTLTIPIDAGVYRVEVERGRRGWIYSNHIKLVDKH